MFQFHQTDSNIYTYPATTHPPRIQSIKPSPHTKHSYLVTRSLCVSASDGLQKVVKQKASYGCVRALVRAQQYCIWYFLLHYDDIRWFHHVHLGGDVMYVLLLSAQPITTARIASDGSNDITAPLRVSEPTESRNPDGFETPKTNTSLLLSNC